MANNLDDGTYVMLNLANTSLALDCVGASDYNGANVQLFTRNDTDAQLVRVWTRSDGTRQLCFAASGKCVDVTNADFSHGANVAQYTANDTAAQQWSIMPVDGTTGTVSGTSYQAYKVYCAITYSSSSTANLLLEASGTGTPSSGTNLVISEDEGTSQDQMWLFVPMPPVADGAYVMRSALGTSLVADLNGCSHAAGARVCISGWHFGTGVEGGNNQVVRVSTDSSTGQSAISFAHSHQLMEVADLRSSASAGAHVVQSTDDGGTDQRWVIVPYGTAHLNGTIVPTYEVRNVAATGTPLCLDVTNGSTTAGTWLELWEQNHTKAQLWIFDPSPIYTEGLTAPSMLGIAPASSVEPSAMHAVHASDTQGSWHAALSGRASAWQLRYRTRTRRAATGAWGGWSSWLSMGDLSEANGGWGRRNAATTTQAEDGVVWSPAFSVPTLLGKGTDAVEAEVEARAFAASGDGTSYVGPSVSQVSVIAFVPTATITAAEAMYDGLHATYTVDEASASIWSARLTSIALGGAELLAGAISLDGTSGTATIPWPSLASVPAAGSTLTCTCTVTDGSIEDASTSTVSAAWADGATLSFEPAFSVTDRMTVEVTVPAHAADAVLLVAGDAMEEAESVFSSDSQKVYEVAPPLGTEWSIMVASRETSGSTSAWCATTVKGPTILPAFVWTWTDARARKRAAALFLRRGGTPTVSDSLSADATAYETVGRERPVYRSGATLKRDISADGTIVPDAVEGYGGLAAWSTRDAFRELMGQRRALFRGPDGTRAKAYVTGISMPHESGLYADVSVTQSEEAR